MYTCTSSHVYKHKVHSTVLYYGGKQLQLLRHYSGGLHTLSHSTGSDYKPKVVSSKYTLMAYDPFEEGGEENDSVTLISLPLSLKV